MSNTIAIITARGGSKRIPRKNIREFLGKPIIAYSIQAAIESDIFDDVIVSTDDNEIAEISKKYGASVPFMRSNDNSNDYADTTDVLLEVLNTLESQGKKYDAFCCIYPTAPFITAKKLIDSYEMLKIKSVNNVVPMVPFSFPPQRGMKVVEKYVVPVDICSIEKRSQDLDEILHDAGQFYWCKTAAFLQNTNILYNNTLPYILTELEVQDIDNESDWKLAEIKYSYMKDR